MKAIILKWLPASWKSTLAKEYWFPIVNWDTLRKEFSELKESDIRHKQYELIQKYALEKSNVVWDNTFINQQTLNDAIHYAKNYYDEVEVIDVFEKLIEETWTSLWALVQCIIRNEKREEKVPMTVITEMYLKSWYKLSDKPVIIVDLDGTLYNIEHRLKYVRWDKKNWNKFESEEEVEKDKIVQPLRDALDALWEHFAIFYVSWRKNTMCDVTQRNFVRDGVLWDCLLMRNYFDSRKDNLVKQDFLNAIKKNHNIAFVIDDRKQVIDMWRSNWLYVLNACQLEDNDF